MVQIPTDWDERPHGWDLLVWEGQASRFFLVDEEHVRSQDPGSGAGTLHDELMADWAGLTGATGTFRAGWFLRFLGLEDFPRYRPGGRLDLYRGDLSDEAFRVLQELVRSAALNLEGFDAPVDTLEDRARMLAALASLRLDELASPEGPALLERALSAANWRS